MEFLLFLQVDMKDSAYLRARSARSKVHAQEFDFSNRYVARPNSYDCKLFPAVAVVKLK